MEKKSSIRHSSIEKFIQIGAHACVCGCAPRMHPSARGYGRDATGRQIASTRVVCVRRSSQLAGARRISWGKVLYFSHLQRRIADWSRTLSPSHIAGWPDVLFADISLLPVFVEPFDEFGDRHSSCPWIHANVNVQVLLSSTYSTPVLPRCCRLWGIEGSFVGKNSEKGKKEDRLGTLWENNILTAAKSPNSAQQRRISDPRIYIFK